MHLGANSNRQHLNWDCATRVAKANAVAVVAPIQLTRAVYAKNDQNVRKRKTSKEIIISSVKSL